MGLYSYGRQSNESIIVREGTWQQVRGMACARPCTCVRAFVHLLVRARARVCSSLHLVCSSEHPSGNPSAFLFVYPCQSICLAVRHGFKRVFITVFYTRSTSTNALPQPIRNRRRCYQRMLYFGQLSGIAGGGLPRGYRCAGARNDRLDKSFPTVCSTRL